MTAMLNIRDLRAYYGQVQALHGLEFGLNEGSLTTLLGANGAGKTTTLRAICNMVRSTGSIEFDGASLTGRSTENIVRLGIAHVPQGRGTFTTLTVEENLQLGAITRKDKAGVVSDIERMYDHFPVLKERHTGCQRGFGFCGRRDFWRGARSDTSAKRLEHCVNACL